MQEVFTQLIIFPDLASLFNQSIKSQLFSQSFQNSFMKLFVPLIKSIMIIIFWMDEQLIKFLYFRYYFLQKIITINWFPFYIIDIRIFDQKDKQKEGLLIFFQLLRTNKQKRGDQFILLDLRKYKFQHFQNKIKNENEEVKDNNAPYLKIYIFLYQIEQVNYLMMKQNSIILYQHKNDDAINYQLIYYHYQLYLLSDIWHFLFYFFFYFLQFHLQSYQQYLILVFPPTCQYSL
ncbi:transmembrane protein, putative (macronuclear) [Tetrahymena thermophila SB210]|uniref:Transmembrane protein, putative n=1 Tax=Tetrahymena thermophila (strain SB210) TaxID=312017 RepID=W7XJN3_TETTS|nr:transmembrane protein, putative [Tetrahymena thermophila SB210]EWS75701.1 transmembrane protein, putative [Tetrahymena thermophila SB210]|eukprot:XP_012651774.1 transmembrane protein, putative [Tetrahymena thermophila SB210]